MKKVFTTLMALAVGISAMAQGGISDEALKKIKEGYKGTPEEVALRNAISRNDINKLAVNLESQANIDTYFSHKVPSKGITDQESSGRCWLFTGMNVLRAEMIKKYNLGPFQFSQNYSFFWDQLEKSNLFLQGIIDTKSLPADDRKVDWLFKHALGDGGQFTGVSDIITKYGLVPAEVMPETYSSNNTSRMSNLLNLKLKEFGLELREMKNDAKKLEARKVEMLSFIYRFLVLNLGEPPTEFEWTMYDAAGKPVSTKKYTPKSFYDEYVGKDLKGSYVLFMNDPTREFYKVYEIEYDRHQYDGANWVYVNLPIEEIKKMAIASIKDSTMMYFSCDVGKFYNREKGILDVNYYDYGSLMGTEFGMDKRERILTGSSGSSHAMTLMAVDLDENGNPKKWMVENSWGMTGYKGHLIMTDEWFDEYMFRVVVDKKYVPQNILELMKQKPTMLPPWDPMFASEE
ncbi:MAG: C1 family peptidase [Bacteroidales bacterium]|nr:C1 family peptidase [Bacteroidales bacterium]MBO7320327.1 C1 family peptidase [Bacteroidales bacterium]